MLNHVCATSLYSKFCSLDPPVTVNVFVCAPTLVVGECVWAGFLVESVDGVRRRLHCASHGQCGQSLVTCCHVDTQDGPPQWYAFQELELCLRT